MDTIPQDNTPRKRCNDPDCENPWLPATTEYFYFRKSTNRLNPQCKACLKRKANARYHQPEVQARVSVYSRLPEVKASRRAHQRVRSRRPDIKAEKHLYDLEYRQRPEVRKHKRDYTRAYYRRPGIHESLRTYQNEYARVFSQRPEQQVRSRINSHTRRSRKMAIPGVLTTEQIQQKLRLQRFRCYYCHDRFEKRKGKYIYHIEHTVPVSRTECNPRHDINYVVLACSPCNLKKHNKLPHEWPEGGRLL